MSESYSIKEILKSISEKLAEYITKAETVNIVSYPDTVSLHASLLIASLVAEKKERIKVSLYLDVPSQDQEGIFVGYDVKEKELNKNAIIIKKSLTVSTKSKVEVISLNPVLQAINIMENISLVQDTKIMVAYSSIFQNLHTIEENDPLLSFIHSETPIKLKKKTVALIQNSKRSILDLLYHTIDPFFYSLSASESEKIASKLKEKDIDPANHFLELTDEKLKEFSNLLLNELSYKSLKQLKKELLRPILYYQIGDREYDLKEVGEAIDIALEVSPGSVISFYTSFLPLEGILALRLHNLKWISEVMKAIIDKKIKVDSDGILNINCDQPRPVHFLGNLARKMGVIDNSIVVCSYEGKKATSVFELAKAPKELRKSITLHNSLNTFPFVYVS